MTSLESVSCSYSIDGDFNNHGIVETEQEDETIAL